MVLIFLSCLLAGCGVNTEVREADTENMEQSQLEPSSEAQLESSSEGLSDVVITEATEGTSLAESKKMTLQMMRDIAAHGNPAMVNAYRELLEQERFDWDGDQFYSNLSSMKFSLVGVEDEDASVYLLLQNNASYNAGGFEHILVYQDGEVKTLWGYGKNCIYLLGYTTREDDDSYTYVYAYGGFDDSTYSYLLRLSDGQVYPTALYHSYPDWTKYLIGESVPKSDYIEEYYWMEQEVDQEEFHTNYEGLKLEQMINIEWINNTDENRQYIFGDQ